MAKANQAGAASTMANHVGAAVIGEVAGRVVSKVMDTLRRRPAVDEKLRRLKTLVVQLRSAVEVSEKLAVESASLRAWRDRLKEAASEGHRVLLGFRQPAAEADAAGADAEEEHESSDDVHKEDASEGRQERATGAGAAKEGSGESGAAASMARNTLLGMARGIRSATAALLSGGEGAEKLSSTVYRLEEWEDAGEFIRLIQVEASREKKSTTSETDGNKKRKGSFEEEEDEEGAKRTKMSKAMERPGGSYGLLLSREPTLVKEPAMATAVKDLEVALAGVTGAVEMADSRDLTGLKWLAEWADMLRDAVQQGRAILTDAKGDKQAEGEEDDADQLCSAVDSMEDLAMDADCFISLVLLCPSL
ncbi:hypothetical protein ACP4OV_008452 [Aristida adscensionis]